MSSDASQNLSANVARNGTDPSGSRWWSLLPVLATICLVAVPMALYGLAPEINNWRIAAANEAMVEGGYDAAVESISESIESNPENIPLLLQRANFHAQAEEHELALQDLDRIEQLGSPNAGGGSPAWLALQLERASTLNQLGEFSKAESAIDLAYAQLNENTLLDPDKMEPYWLHQRNNLAYFYSQIDRKLPRAEQLADLACEGVPSRKQATMMLAQLHSMLGQDQQALQFYNAAIAQAANDYERQRDRLALKATDAMQYGVPTRREQTANIKSALQDTRSIGRVYQNLLLGRAAIHQRSGRKTEAEEDKATAKSLGRFRDQARQSTQMEMLMSALGINTRSIAGVQSLAAAGAYIDTRGCVRFRQGKYQEALLDFQMAIDIERAILPLSVGEEQEPYPDLIDKRIPKVDSTTANRNAATLYYHRMLAREKLGDTAGALEDKQTIEGLGIEIRASLF